MYFFIYLVVVVLVVGGGGVVVVVIAAAAICRFEVIRKRICMLMKVRNISLDKAM